MSRTETTDFVEESEAAKVASRHRAGTVALLCCSAGATAWWTVYSREPYPLPLLLLAVASFGPLLVVVLARPLRAALTLRLLAVLTAFLLLFSMAFARPGRGGDLWVYAVYGRIIVEHGDNPYVHPPNDYPHDPWAQDLELYSSGRAFYGPAFIGLTAGIAAVGGESRALVRLGYQMGAAMALVAAVLLLLHLGASLHAIALVALNPVLIVEVVSQGRMDAYVGLGLLIAVALARRRPHAAAVAIAAAALIKIPAALALLGLVCWVWRRDGGRRALTVAATAAATMAVAYVAAGGTAAVRALLAASDQANDLSVWVLFRNVPEGLQRALGDPTADLGALGAIPAVASVAAVVLAGLFVLASIDERRPVLVIVMPVVAYMLTSLYPTSWYLGWVLPVLALRLRSRALWTCLALFSLLMVNAFYGTAARLQEGARSLADFARPSEDVVLRILHAGVTGIEIVALVVLVSGAVRSIRSRREETRRDRPSPPGVQRVPLPGL